MSELSYLEKLLDGAEVQWMALGSVIKTVTAPSKLKSQAYRASGKLPIIDQGIKFIAGYTDEDVAPVEAGKYIIFGDHSEHIKYVDFRFVQGADGLKILSPISDNAKYIYHAFLNFYTKELSYKRHWSSAQQTLIPIPCPNDPEKSLAIQAEIVRVLDKFTALTAELTAELTERKKQYNYYRDQLLSFEDGEVEWKSLGEVAIITIGAFVRKDKQNPDADYPVYNGGRTPTGYYEDFNNDGDKVIVSARGANAGFVNKSSTPYWAGNSCYSISVRSTEQLHWMYVYYYLKQSETKLTGIQQKGGIPAVSKKQMEDLLLPIPSKSEQVRIVTILDKFDTLTSSITEGLPREIELRQKQYEYYRELLFSFPRSETASN